MVLKPDAQVSDSSEWSEYLRCRLPAYMMPSSFVVLGELPLSSNGKVDSSALLRAAGEQSDLHASSTPPRNEVEQKLAALWEEVLGVKQIGVHDRFFELGGHSLLAVRLLAKIEKTFERKLPVSSVFQHPTVAQLSELLISETAVETHAPTSLIDIQPNGERPPIYMVHGVGGGMFWGYANLSRHLGSDQPVHAFKSRGLDGLPEWETIGEMARSYVADLKAAQPEGPYVLGGYCFGGNVAYEMARQLKEQGDEVALVVLISCSPPNSKYETTRFLWSPSWMLKFGRNTALWLTSFLFRWDIQERRNFILWKWRLLRKKLKGLVRSRSSDASVVAEVDTVIDLSAVGGEQRRLWDSHMRSLMLHHPRPYDGKVVLFRSAEHLFFCSFDEQCGWGELARDVTVKIVPGDHGRVLEEPFVAAVADELRKTLDETVRSGEMEVAA
jgi:thioesterase domain-containing protein/acyl carrier protein